MTMRRLAGASAALLASACASVHGAPAVDPAAADRAADDAALEAAAADLAPLEDHFVTLAGGGFLGAALLLEDAARFLEGRPEAHAYLFVRGTEGDRRVPTPALYGPRVAGAGLLGALGLEAVHDPAEGTLTLRRGEAARTFRTGGGAAAATFLLEPASGLGRALEIDLVVAPGFGGTVLVSPEDAAALGLALSEIPGTAVVSEVLSGRTVPCRRALCRVSLEGLDEEPGLRASALVEVLFPR